MSFGEKIQAFRARYKREKASARGDFFDASKREWKLGTCMGEMGYPHTTFREILPDKPSPDGMIGPSGINPDFDLDWTGQPGGTYFDLKDRIVENYKYNVSTENVILCNGAGGGDFIIPMAVLKPGDEVVIERPSWFSFEPLSYMMETKAKVLPLKEDLGWKWDMDELNETVTNATKMIFICNPNNPTGRIYNEKELKAICEIASDAGAYIISDEEYRGVELDQPSMSMPAACNLYYNAASVEGVSKLFCGTGMRIGWVASQNSSLLSKADAVKGFLGGLGGFQVAMAWAANEPSTMKRIVEGHINFAKKSRAALKEFMDHQDFFRCFMPEAGFLSFPGWIHNIDTVSFVDGLYDSKRVLCWPSTMYFMEKHIRLGYGRISTEIFKESLKLIGEYLQELQAS